MNFIAIDLYGNIIASGETRRALERELEAIDPTDSKRYTIHEKEQPMKTELIMLLLDTDRMVQDANGVYKPIYDSAYVSTQIRICERGNEWACINGSWYLVREDNGVRYVRCSI